MKRSEIKQPARRRHKRAPAPLAPLATTNQQQQQQQQRIIHSIAGQQLVVPCRNYTQLALVTPSNSPSELPAAAAARRRPVSGTQTRLSAMGGSAKQQQPTAPFSLIVPQLSGISLLVWHKDDQLNSPIFAADARGVSSILEARQQVSSEQLRNRARLELVDGQNRIVEHTQQNGSGAIRLPALVIEDANLQDAGLYTCSVEFHKAPTQTYQTRVTVLDPPKNMQIRFELLKADGNGDNEPGQRLHSPLAGPFDEDAHLALTCQADPGHPSAGQVSWWQLESVVQLNTGNGGGGGGADASRRLATGSPGMRAAAHPLDTKAAYVTTINFDDLESSSLETTATATGTTTHVDADSVLGADDDATNQANAVEQNPLQSEDLFLAAHASELEAQQFVAQYQTFGPTMRLAAGLWKGRLAGHLRLWRRVQNQTMIVTNQTNIRLESRFEISQLSRVNLGETYLCLALNDELLSLTQSPLNASITLNLNLKPREVRLELGASGGSGTGGTGATTTTTTHLAGGGGGGATSNHKSNLTTTFRLGQKVMVECHALGSKPSAQIKWFRGAREIELLDRERFPLAAAAAEQQVSEFNRDISNLTKISYLTFVPQLSDNQQRLTCSAANNRMPQAPTLSDSLLMNVEFAPQLELKFGSQIRPDAIHLNGDIFMDCHLEANPPINELIWLRNGQPLVANLSAGIIMSNQSLVLRQLRIEHRGAYQCAASNLLGRTLSNKLDLRPKFAPICDQQLTKIKYEVALNQPTRIECHVLAEPGEDLHFSWRFNRTHLTGGGGGGTDSENHYHDQASRLGSSGQQNDSNDDDDQLERDYLALMNGGEIRQYETNFTRSSVIFTPRSRRHFGQLLCSATNSMGKQERPCSIQIIQSELPDPVLGCFVDNQTHSSFSIHCQPPALGSSSAAAAARAGQTYFILELFANETATRHDQQQQQQQQRSPGQSQDRKQRQQQSGGGGGGGGEGTHLSLRQPDGLDANGANDNNNNDDDDDGDADYQTAAADSANELDTQRDAPDRGDEFRERRRVKRLLSETPSFNVLDLKPNSSYNVLVYVQNSKGRSAPTHHQVVTRPLDSQDERQLTPASSSSSVASSGRLELFGSSSSSSSSVRNSIKGEQGGFGSKLLAYLPLGNYFSQPEGRLLAASKHPLASFALVVLLATISVVTLVFFTNRLLCQARRRQRRQQATGSKARVAPLASEQQQQQSQDESEEYDFSSREQRSRRPSSEQQLASLRQMQPHLAARERAIDAGNGDSSGTSSMRPLVSSTSSSASLSRNVNRQRQQQQQQLTTLNTRPLGSGSDTSRETNTDSTLISSPQTNTTESSSCKSTRGQRHHGNQQAIMCNYNSMQMPLKVSKCSRDNLSNSNSSSQQRQQQPTIYSVGSLENSRNYNHHHDQLAVAYSMLGIGIGRQHQCSPTTALATTTTPPANIQQQTSTLFGDGGVYVLDHANVNQHQISDDDGGGASLQNRCSLVETQGDDHEMLFNGSQVGQQQHYYNNNNNNTTTTTTTGGSAVLPNSFSIPISLNDRLQVLARSNSVQDHHELDGHRLDATRGAAMLLEGPANNQSYCNTLGTTTSGSYLALAPASSSSFITATTTRSSHANDPTACMLDYCSNQMPTDLASDATSLSVLEVNGLLADSQQVHALTPPIDFASDYRRFKQAFGISVAGAAADDDSQRSSMDRNHSGDSQQQQQQQLNIANNRQPQRHRVKFEGHGDEQ